MTGDFKFSPDADIVIMTLEILRNRLFKQGSSTQSVGLSGDLSLESLGGVVFDEAHFFVDRDRGHAWEESLILLPPGVQCCLLSATMDQPEDFSAWLGDIRSTPCNLISTQYRVVPLVFGVMGPDFELITLGDSRPSGAFKEKV